MIGKERRKSSLMNIKEQEKGEEWILSTIVKIMNSRHNDNNNSKYLKTCFVFLYHNIFQKMT